jgi:membrane associated rhomboid family serine protease
LSNILGSSGMFITVVTAGLAGSFAALIAVAFNAPGPVVGVTGAAAGIAHPVIGFMLGMRKYRRIRRRPVLFPAPGAQEQP